MSVRAAAEFLVARAEAHGRKGRVLAPEEVGRLERELGGIYPQWLSELLSLVPLCGLQMGWRDPDSDPNNLTWLGWSDANSVLWESLEGYPGLAILPAGYVNVASCSHGSGDPYFICVHDGPDLPLYQVDHESGDEAGVILARGRYLVSPRLSEFLQNVIVAQG